MTLNPEELDLDTAAMQAKYDETMREQQSQLEKEDLSDMVAAHAAKQRVSCRQIFFSACHQRVGIILVHMYVCIEAWIDLLMVNVCVCVCVCVECISCTRWEVF